MEWLQPEPASIAPLAELMFGLVITLYLLATPHKSKDAWVITVHYGLFTALYLAAFINTATLQASWHEQAEAVQFLILAILTTYNLWFAYVFWFNPFPKEMVVLVGLAAALYSISVFTGKSAIIWTFPLFMFLSCWIMVIFLRKAVWVAYREKSKSNDSTKSTHWLKTLIREIRNPSNQNSKLCLGFAFCYLIYFLVSVDATLGNLGLISKWWYVHVQVLIFLYITLEMLVYINHAKETTTLLVKLVGIFLCLTLIILGLLGFLLYGLDASSQTDRDSLKTLAILIPIATCIIVLGAPLFFHSSLLHPLRMVVKGVQAVNQGDLSIQIPVVVHDEIGTLAESFNRMTTSLQTYSQEMESLVGQRTSELEKKSLQMQQQKEELQDALEQLKSVQAQLVANDAQKTRFFDNITHEFRTPLTLILSPLEQLLYKNEDRPELQAHLQVIKRNAGQLLRLINQLLYTAKLKAGGSGVKLQTGNIGACIEGLTGSFLPMAAGKNIRLLYHNHLNGPYAFDSEKLEHIGYNLLSNALKFTPENGQVVVSLQQANHKGALGMAGVVLSVSDNGIGIAQDKLPYIFDRFFQANAHHRFSQAGTGIGLSLVKELVEVLDGKITVESQPGTYTNFTVELPFKPIQDEIQEAQLPQVYTEYFHPSPAPGLEKQQEIILSDAPLVLVVEDNRELREFIVTALSREYRVLTAGNGREGLEIALAELPEVIISDVMMPEMDGFTFCQKIKTIAETDHIALILLTARASHESRMEGLAQGADDYLTKPFHLQELQLKLANLLSRQQKLRERYGQLSGPTTGFSKEIIGDPFLVALYEVIEKYLDNPLFGVEMLAEEVAKSPRTLSRKLQTLTGTSPARLIRSYRFKRAVEFLASGYSVSETAYQVGFDNPSYFATAFKEFYGQTPSEYIANPMLSVLPQNKLPSERH